MLLHSLVSTPAITYTLCNLDCDIKIEGIHEALCMYVVNDRDMIVAAMSIVLYQQIVLASAVAFFLVGLFSVAPLALLAIPSLHAPSTLWFGCAFTAVSVFGCHWVKGWDLASQPFLALVAFPFGLTVCQSFVVPHGAGKRVGRMSCKALGNQKTPPYGDVWVYFGAFRDTLVFNHQKPLHHLAQSKLVG